MAKALALAAFFYEDVGLVKTKRDDIVRAYKEGNNYCYRYCCYWCSNCCYFYWCYCCICLPAILSMLSASFYHVPSAHLTN